MKRTTFIGAMIRRAARTAPACLAARLEEEWLADLRERRGTWSRLRFALGCCWAGIAIGLEHRPAAMSVAGPIRAEVTWLAHGPRLTPRAVTLGLVLSLHAAVLCGLIMAGTRQPRQPEPPALEPRMIDRSLPQIEPPLVGRPVIARLPGPIVIPPPEVGIPDAETPNVTGPVETAAGDAAAPVAVIPPLRVQGGVGVGFPDAGAYYPDVSRRLQEQGAALLRVCVDAEGRLIGAPSMEESSGSARLDAAALRLAKAGSGHYRPSSDDGTAVDSCYPLKIRFRLRE